MKINFKISTIIISVFLISSCQSNDKGGKVTSKERKKFKLIGLTSKPVKQEVHLPGMLQAFQYVQIYPKVNGFIKEVYVDRGSLVHKGEALIIMEAPEMLDRLAAEKLKYLRALSGLEISKDHYIRLLQTSHTAGTVSAYDLQSAKSKMMADSDEMQGELAGFKAQESMASYLKITAPFDGVITERNIHPGALAGPGSQGNSKPLLVLQEQSKLRLVVSLPEEYSVQIKKGITIHFSMNALPGQMFKADIARISGALSDKFRTETIEADVNNSGGKLEPGMYAEVSIPSPGNLNAFEVPASSIIINTEKRYVVVSRSGHYKFIDITEGNHGEVTEEVFGDIHKGDLLVANADESITEGDVAD
jgi:membrane fusion protein (multidrug efflux system)